MWYKQDKKNREKKRNYSLFIAAIFTFASMLILDAGAAEIEWQEKQSFKDWALFCGKQTDAKNPAAAKTHCFLQQKVILQEAQSRLLQCRISYVDQLKQFIVLLSLPLGISLPPGTTLQIDDIPAQQLALEYCDAQGCHVILALQPDLLAAFKAGQQAVITFFDKSRRSIGVPLSLKGISAGFAALKQQK